MHDADRFERRVPVRIHVEGPGVGIWRLGDFIGLRFTCPEGSAMTIMSQRCCGNCAHYRKGNGGCPGQCNHPARQAVSDVPVYVRTRELACRSTWNQDLWQQGVLQLDEPTVKVRDIVVWQSVSLDLAPDDYPEDLLDWLVALASDESQSLDLRDWLS